MKQAKIKASIKNKTKRNKRGRPTYYSKQKRSSTSLARLPVESLSFHCYRTILETLAELCLEITMMFSKNVYNNKTIT